MRLLKRLLLPVIFVLSTTVVAHALPCDNRGSNWQGRIDIGPKIWGFELRRQTCAATSPWNYYLWTARGERRRVCVVRNLVPARYNQWNSDEGQRFGLVRRLRYLECGYPLMRRPEPCTGIAHREWPHICG